MPAVGLASRSTARLETSQTTNQRPRWQSKQMWVPEDVFFFSSASHLTLIPTLHRGKCDPGDLVPTEAQPADRQPTPVEGLCLALGNGV